MGILSFIDTNTSLQQVVSDLLIDVVDGGTITLRVATTPEYDFNKDQADFNSNNIVNLGTLNTNTIPAGTDTFAMLGANQSFTGINTFRQNDVACVIDGNSSGGASFNATSFNNNVNAGGFFDGSKARGTLDIPVAVEINDLLAGVSGLGHDGVSSIQSG